jgi:ATP-dependent Clp protease protease subunit
MPEILDMQLRLDQIVAEHSGQPPEKVARNTDGDFSMSATEAAGYGVIDHVLPNRHGPRLPAPANGQAPTPH